MSPAKPTLVLLHGFLGNKLDWQPVIHLLAEQVNCIAVDIEVPNYGAEKDLSFEERCNRLFHRIERHYQLPETFSVLGYSMGGRIALCWSNLFADRIASLILESCHPGLSEDTERQQRLIHDNDWQKRFQSQPLKTVLQSWYQQPVFRSLTEPQITQLIQQKGSTVTPNNLHLLDHFSLGLQSDYSTLQRPSHTHYMYGQRDTKFLHIAQQLKSINNDMLLYQFPESGHNVHLDCLKDYSELISTLLIGTSKHHDDI